MSCFKPFIDVIAKAKVQRQLAVHAKIILAEETPAMIVPEGVAGVAIERALIHRPQQELCPATAARAKLTSGQASKECHVGGNGCLEGLAVIPEDEARLYRVTAQHLRDVVRYHISIRHLTG